MLLISCANVASLFLSQAPGRQREMAIRSALGASRGRLIRSVLAESLFLAALGGFSGVLLAGWGVAAVLAAAPDRMLWMSTTPIELDGRILAVAGLLTLVTGFIFGIFPAWRGSRPNLETTLRGGTAGAGGGSSGRLPGSLVVVEVAFAVVLMVGATLMARTLANLNAIEPGFEPNGVIVMHIALPSDRYPTPAACIQFFDALRDRLRGVAGISAVAASQGTPPAIGALSFGRPEIEGRGIPDTKVATIPNGTVSPEYFRALGMPIIAGRGFTTNDASDVVIVSQAFAEKILGRGERRWRPLPDVRELALENRNRSRRQRSSERGRGFTYDAPVLFSMGCTGDAGGASTAGAVRRAVAQLRLSKADRSRREPLGSHPTDQAADLGD